jgi:large subunit ribosomal protein L5
MPRLKDKYKAEVAQALMKKFSYKSPMQIPKLDKIVVNVGCGDARDNPKALDATVNEITAITGQKAVVTFAKKSVANFKVREGMPVGVKVTLRSDRMWEFLDRLLNVALPRVRDFRGIGRDAFEAGAIMRWVQEQLIFPSEIDIIIKKHSTDPRHGISYAPREKDEKQGTAHVWAPALRQKLKRAICCERLIKKNGLKRNWCSN